MKIKPDPLGIPRDPLAVFLLCLALVSGIGFVVNKPSSGSLEEALPHWGMVVWGLSLTFGSALSLIGMFWPWQVRDGLLIKRVGMGALAISAVVYACSVWVTFGWKAATPGGFVFFFGYACYLRYRNINRAIHLAIVKKIIDDEQNGSGS